MWLRMTLPAVDKPTLHINKLGASCVGCDQGSWINVSSVVYNGSQRVHAASDLGVRLRTGDGRVSTFAALDSALVRVGEGLTPLPMPSTKPETHTFAFNLLNNAWGTSK